MAEVVAGVFAGAALGVAASLAVGDPREFVARQQSKWHPENRPSRHPMDCDFRAALGMMQGIAYTTKDIKKSAKQASRWWHADANGGVDHGFADFKRIVAILEISRLRCAYASEVEEELRLVSDLGQEVQWRTFNERFARSVECKQRVWTPRATSKEPAGVEICHVFLDATGSMTSSTEAGRRITVGKKLFRDVFPRFATTPTNVHLIGDKEGPHCSRCIVSHGDVLPDVEGVLKEWQPFATRTCLWHYIFKQVKYYKDAKHEVFIVTDGHDNGSPDSFRGLTGFNELMARLEGAKIRVSLRLVGNSLPASDACVYRDLCLATGGFFASGDSDDSALWSLVVPFLLPEGEREQMALGQRATYQQLLSDGEAQKFSWYAPIAAGERSSTGAPPASQVFCPSARVTLHGLQAAPELNGEVGTVEKWLGDSGRWQVRLDRDRRPRSVKRGNLTVLPK